MFKRVLIILIAGIFIFGMNKLSFAMMCGEHSEQKQMAQTHTEHEQGAAETTKQAVAEKTVNVGNKICPVSGEKIEEKTKTTYEYDGKIYNFCCPMCIDEFKKDPGKYIKKVDEELKSESEAKSKEHMMMPESKASGSMHGSGH